MSKVTLTTFPPSLTPHGVSGLKSLWDGPGTVKVSSHPTRGEWIEIPVSSLYLPYISPSHPTRGEWIEMCRTVGGYSKPAGLTPHGVSGLKFHGLTPITAAASRLTPHGVSGLKSSWSLGPCLLPWSHPTRGEWIEIAMSLHDVFDFGSHPTRGEWIEILPWGSLYNPGNVSPHTG